MIRLIHTFLAVCMAIIPAVGAGNDSADILTHASEAFRKAGGISAEFTVNADGHSYKGEIILSGDRFRLSTPQMYVWYDGRTQWSYNPDIQEVNITEPTPEELMEINPFAIISSFTQNYTSKLLSSTKSSYRVLLTPRQEMKPIVTKAILTIDASTYLPTDIAVTLDSGQSMAISIKSLNKGKNYPQSTFVFNKKSYPKAEIVDLR